MRTYFCVCVYVCYVTSDTQTHTQICGGGHRHTPMIYHNDMGWLWLVGWIKLQVSFAKETYKRDAILQKRPIILSILLTVATPYDIRTYF